MEEIKSKSQKKRDADKLQQLGTKFIALNSAQLNQLDLPSELKEAILEAKHLKTHGAKRRQQQLIGKLMRVIDAEEIQAKYDELCAESKSQTAQFHEVEVWRTRLLTESKTALTEFIDKYNDVDIQHLRQLVKNATQEQKQAKSTGAGKALFRYLRSYVK